MKVGKEQKKRSCKWNVLYLGLIFLVLGCSRLGVTNKAITTTEAVNPKAIEGSGNMKSLSQVPEARKLIYTAHVELVAPDPRVAVQELEKRLASFEAYTSSQDVYAGSISLEVRVPVSRFQEFLNWVDTLGKVRRKNVQARDVTDQYYDLENRVKNKRILVERYQTYLKNAKNIEDLLNIERFLNEALAELESLEGQFRGLVKQVDYATVNVTFESEVSVRIGDPGLGQSLKNLLASYSFVLQRIVVVLIGIILYGIPLAILSALLWFLLFGRVGLLKKLFRLVSSNEKEGGEKT